MFAIERILSCLHVIHLSKSIHFLGFNTMELSFNMRRHVLKIITVKTYNVLSRCNCFFLTFLNSALIHVILLDCAHVLQCGWLIMTFVIVTFMRLFRRFPISFSIEILRFNSWDVPTVSWNLRATFSLNWFLNLFLLWLKPSIPRKVSCLFRTLTHHLDFIN